MTGKTFSGIYRRDILQKMTEEVLDILVIGGGITGAGIALDAASRGMKPALIEMQDYAAGTSSRSTKLVHGGLRYLKQLEIKIVAEVGKERAIVYENGPHVTTPEWMLLPIYAGGTFGKLSTSFGLRLYDYLAGVKKGERRKMLKVEETLKREPLLVKNGLKGSGYYVEYRTDDARLTIEVMKKAVELGARAVNYAKVEELLYEKSKLIGVVVVDQLSGHSYRILAKKVINATGPWVDTLREKDDSNRGKTLHLTKGVHLVFDQSRFPLKQAVYFDTPDHRMVFAIPRAGKTYVGTTDTNYSGDKVNPQLTMLDRSYLLAAVNSMFPTIKLSAEDVESSWTGLRPLIHQEGKDPSEISRRDEVLVSDSGLISIAGGKLTGYRKMAEAVVNQAVALLEQEGSPVIPASRTMRLPISGGDLGGSAKLEAFVSSKREEAVRLGLSAAEAERLVRRYGTNVADVLERIRKLGAAGSGEQPLLQKSVEAELAYSIDHEMTVKPVDFFIRRTGALYFDIDWVNRWKAPVIGWMKERLEWSDETAAGYAQELEERLHEATVPAERDHF
ncbi:MAG: glycerol-3-phosphate dehydrogenase [Paenibacillus sp.]|nr:glycerol-3-phosphate dehydrogenase [Paenibacillus sp.]